MNPTLSTKKQAWLYALRLRTLPLALSSIIMGSIIAYKAGEGNWSIFILASLTTVLLQVLSNLANDYGDSANGADHEGRKGPIRSVQSGMISLQEMKLAIFLFGMLSFVSGLALLYLATQNWLTFALFLGIGILSILAAITYTYGGKPYGYAGLGDIAVFLFFGWVGVMGTYYLHTLNFEWPVLLPASAIGLFSTAVLNINNIRDIDSDRSAGKKSLPVRFGKTIAVYYHWSLIIIGVLLMLWYILKQEAYGGFLFLLATPLMLETAWAVQKLSDPEAMDPYLKKMALATLFSVLAFGLGWIIF